jgi:hypothetical protein
MLTVEPTPVNASHSTNTHSSDGCNSSLGWNRWDLRACHLSDPPNLISSRFRLHGEINVKKRFNYTVSMGYYVSIKYIRVCGTIRSTPLFSQVYNYTGFVLKTLILLNIALCSRKWRYYDISHCFCIMPIKLGNEYDNFKALYVPWGTSQLGITLFII